MLDWGLTSSERRHTDTRRTDTTSNLSVLIADDTELEYLDQSWKQEEQRFGSRAGQSPYEVIPAKMGKRRNRGGVLTLR